MGMSAPVVPVVISIVERWKKENPNKTPKVVSMGYPDILMDVKDIPLEGLEVHPEAKSISKYHGRDLNIPTTESFFKALGCEFTCVDIKQWRGSEFIGNLNFPLYFIENKDKNTNFVTRIENFDFNILLDLGTTEHCFNVGQVMSNYVDMLDVGGYAVHWNPHYMPNHGFYNFSPTFFHDFYNTNGYRTFETQVYEYKGPEDEQGYLVPSTRRYTFPSVNSSSLNVAYKEKEVAKIKWPCQTKYKNLEKMNVE